jgi:hypothetical protein
VWIVVAAAALAPGLDYYRTPVSERGWSDLHAQFSPAGPMGHGYGVVGTVMITIGVVGYMARKRFAALARFGKLRQWLEVHIFLCTLGPFLVLLHTSFKFGGIVAISFWSMVAVVASGVFGRYVYVWIPKTLNGRFRSAQSIQSDLDELTRAMLEAAGEREEALAAVGPVVATPGGLGALGRTLRFRAGAHARRRHVEHTLDQLGVEPERRRAILRLAEGRSRLELQITLLQPLQRLFRWWHTFHLPLAIVMFLILIVHVAVAVAFGYVWVLD